MDSTASQYKLHTTKCDAGHVFRTAGLLLEGEKWCLECDGPIKTINIISKNLNAKTSKPFHVLPKNFEPPGKVECYAAFGTYEWQCNRGHTWSATLQAITEGEWCKRCMNSEFSNTLVLENIAKLYNGECLTKVATHIIHHEWRCSKRHIFRQTAIKALNGKWCKTCYDNPDVSIFRDPLTVRTTTLLKKVMELDVNKEIDPDYVRGLMDKYKSLKAKSLYLTSKYNTLEKIKVLALENDVICLSNLYVNETTNLEFKCSNSHIWISSLDPIIRGVWCPECKSDADDELSRKRRQAILDYFNRQELRAANRKKREEIKLQKALNPNKGLSAGNIAVRNYFAKVGIKFEPEFSFADCVYKRPLRFDFRIEINGRPILIEFDGAQHFHRVNHFHRTDLKFIEQLEKDIIKEKYCMFNLIKLVRINNVYSVEQDLDRLLKDDNVHVMFVAVTPEVYKQYGGYLKTGPDDYITV